MPEPLTHRAPLDSECDLYLQPYLPGESVPIYPNKPCRMVPLPYILLREGVLALRTHYMTTDYPEGVTAGAGLVGEILEINLPTGMLVAWPAGVEPNYIVLFHEIISLPSGFQYFRYHLAPWPLTP